MPFVKTTDTKRGRIYWILLPGDNAAHSLDESEARQLLRELEEVV